MAKETFIAKKRRALRILNALEKRFPDARIALDYDRDSAWQLLVAVMLSAQCTDAKVNQATPALFKRFPNVNAFAKTTAAKIVPLIKTLGLAPTKAARLVQVAQVLLKQHGGEVPADRQQLEALPGIGRKSASVILANAFGIPALAVDTHVGRIARRLDLSKQQDPSKVEAELESLWPEKRWFGAHHALIWHGRQICKARKPDCDNCPVAKMCPESSTQAN